MTAKHSASDGSMGKVLQSENDSYIDLHLFLKSVIVHQVLHIMFRVTYSYSIAYDYRQLCRTIQNISNKIRQNCQ